MSKLYVQIVGKENFIILPDAKIVDGPGSGASTEEILVTNLQGEKIGKFNRKHVVGWWTLEDPSK